MFGREGFILTTIYVSTLVFMLILLLVQFERAFIVRLRGFHGHVTTRGPGDTHLTTADGENLTCSRPFATIRFARRRTIGFFSADK